MRVTLERFAADDRADVAALASAERAGRFVTVASVDDAGRPVRHVAAAGEINTSADTAYKKLRDGRIVERFGENPTQLYLFGAGHVGRALVLALAPLPFAVTWADPRPGAFPAHIPGNVSCVGEGEPVQVLARAPDGALVAVMTHSHALDLDLVAAALKSRRFGYVGLIGSATKRARFVSTMSKLGLAKVDIDRLICPIGLQEIEDKAPAAIAASTVAQLLIVRERGVRCRPAMSTVRARARAGAMDDQGCDRPRSRCCRRSASPSSTAPSSPTITSISICIRPRSTPCWARTAPANRPL